MSRTVEIYEHTTMPMDGSEPEQPCDRAHISIRSDGTALGTDVVLDDGRKMCGIVGITFDLQIAEDSTGEEQARVTIVFDTTAAEIQGKFKRVGVSP